MSYLGVSCAVRSSLIEWRRYRAFTGGEDDEEHAAVDIAVALADTRDMLSQRLLSGDGNDSLRFLFFLEGSAFEHLLFFGLLLK